MGKKVHNVVDISKQCLCIQYHFWEIFRKLSRPNWMKEKATIWYKQSVKCRFRMFFSLSHLDYPWRKENAYQHSLNGKKLDGCYKKFVRYEWKLAHVKMDEWCWSFRWGKFNFSYFSIGHLTQWLRFPHDMHSTLRTKCFKTKNFLLTCAFFSFVVRNEWQCDYTQTKNDKLVLNGLLGEAFNRNVKNGSPFYNTKKESKQINKITWNTHTYAHAHNQMWMREGRKREENQNNFCHLLGKSWTWEVGSWKSF